MTKEKVYTILNTIGLIITISINGLANALPINGQTTGELSDLYPNLFVPTGLTFSIWGIIYLLLLAFVVNQWFIAFNRTKDASFIKNIGPWFLISCVANSSWILAWHYMMPGLSLIIMLVLLFTLIKMYLIIEVSETNSRIDRLMIHVWISVYLGWITVATIANTTAVLVGIGWNGGPIDPAIWTILMIAIAAAMGAYFALVKKDAFYTMVIIWALYGIYLKRSGAMYQEHGIILATQIGMIICGISLLFVMRGKKLKSNQ